MEKISQDHFAYLTDVENAARETSRVQNITYQCDRCQDTGLVIVDGIAKICPCRKKAVLDQKKRASNITPKLAEKSFANFSLHYYPGYQYSEVQQKTCLQLAEDALKACKNFVSDVKADRYRQGVILEGDIGSGKTHLAAAIANELLDAGKDVLFLVVPEFLDELRASYQESNDGTEAALMRKAKNIPILILDDLGAHTYTTWTQSKIFMLLNHRLNYNLPTVITTNLSLTEIGEALGERTASRLLEIGSFYPLRIEQDIRLAKCLE